VLLLLGASTAHAGDPGGDAALFYFFRFIQLIFGLAVFGGIVLVVAIPVGLPYWVAVAFEVRRYRTKTGALPGRSFWRKRVLLFVFLVIGTTAVLFGWMTWDPWKTANHRGTQGAEMRTSHQIAMPHRHS